jgi:hypothetical protein
MKFTIEFSIYAFETYDSITEQIELRWGSKILNEFEQRVLKILSAIQQSPLMFPAVNNEENLRKALIHGNCSVYYEVKTTEIEILFFWDNRQDPIFL